MRLSQETFLTPFQTLELHTVEQCGSRSNDTQNGWGPPPSTDSAVQGREGVNSTDLKNTFHALSPDDKSYPHCHSIITGRKSWKTLRGGTEAVWPPHLEAALFEGVSSNSLIIPMLISSFLPQGLSRYQPSNPRATKSLGRFLNRNRFISEHIFKKTGEHRSSKQVGSRLQQLRDTHQGKQRMSHRPLPFSPILPDLFRL